MEEEVKESVLAELAAQETLRSQLISALPRFPTVLVDVVVSFVQHNMYHYQHSQRSLWKRKTVVRNRHGRFLAVRDVERDSTVWLTGYYSGDLVFAFSPDGRRVAIATQNFAVWDTATGECLLVLEGHTGCVREVYFTCDGRLLAARTRGETRVWDTTNGVCLHVLLHQNTTRIRLAADGSMLVTVSRDGTAKIWHVQSGRCLHTLQGNHVSFSMDCRLVVTSSADGNVRIWESQSGKCLQILRMPNPKYTFLVSRCAFSPNGALLLTDGDGACVQVWSVSSGVCLRTIACQHHFCAFSADGQAIVTISKNGVCVWNAASGKRVHTFQADAVGRACFDDDGRLVVHNYVTGEATVFDVHAGTRVDLQPRTFEVTQLAYSPNGMTVATAETDCTRLWDRASGKCLHTLDVDMKDSRLAFSPNSSMLVTGNGNVSHIVRVTDGRCLHCLRLESYHSAVSYLFSPDDCLLCIVNMSEDSQTVVYDVATGKPRHTLPGRAQCFSSSGTLLAVSDEHIIRVYDMKSGQCIHTLDADIYNLAFSSDDRLLVTSKGRRQSVGSEQ